MFDLEGPLINRYATQRKLRKLFPVMNCSDATCSGSKPTAGKGRFVELSRAGRVAASAVGAILWAGLLLSPLASRAVPPVATNVTALASWPSYATGRAADAHQINEYLYVSLEEGGFQIWNVQNPKEP